MGLSMYFIDKTFGAALTVCDKVDKVDSWAFDNSYLSKN